MVTSLVQKIVRGSSRMDRSTRFHDENDVFIGWNELRHVPRTLLMYAKRRFFGTYPILPWWPYAAIERIAEVLPPTAVVLEYGIGYSTLWLAQRAGHVYGVEGSPEWFQQMKSLTTKRGLDNVTLLLRDSTRYPDRGARSEQFNMEFASLDGIEDSEFDLVVVDGAARWLCVQRALSTIKPGGYLYLDNSDADKDWIHYTTPGLQKEAQRLIEDAASRGLGQVERFRGLSPATLHASEGMLFRNTSNSPRHEGKT